MNSRELQKLKDFDYWKEWKHKTEDSMEKQQTAVQWLIDELKSRGYIFEQKENVLIEKAQEMERDQLIDMYEDGMYAANYPHAMVGYAYIESKFGTAKKTEDGQ